MASTSNDGLRERKSGKQEGDGTKTQERPKSNEKGTGLSTVDILRIIAGLLLLNSSLSYFIMGDSFLWGYRPWFILPRVLMQWIVSSISIVHHIVSANDLFPLLRMDQSS
jgi:hypothetical protein